jgi:endonuclease/exonuclease/phosphatase family metal-dependent hydrolase
MAEEAEVDQKMTLSRKLRKRIEKRWDAIIWMGDFNSRVEGFSLPHPKYNTP